VVEIIILAVAVVEHSAILEAPPEPVELAAVVLVLQMPEQMVATELPTPEAVAAVVEEAEETAKVEPVVLELSWLDI
jgi:uncharacterized protein (DUF362 family)